MADLKLGVNLDLGNVIQELKKSSTKFKQNRTYNKKEYDILLDKYADALNVIECLEAELRQARENKLPTSEEVESIGKLFGMLDTMNKSMPELMRLKKQMEEFDDQ